MSHIQRETSCSRQRLNSNLDADLYGYKWARDNVGHLTILKVVLSVNEKTAQQGGFSKVLRAATL
ncbi:hypothetical protein ACU04M_005276, partial [Escherichia coli]